jgi:hypothetical protein
MTDRDDAIAELRTGHDRFRACIADLPDEKFDETWLGTWNLSQLLAHMAGWYGEMSGAFARVARGQRPTPEGVDYSDADSWNEKFAADAVPGRAALAQFDAAYADYVAAAESLNQSRFGTDVEKGRPKIGNRLLQGAGTGHFEEHQPELEAWLAGR